MQGCLHARHARGHEDSGPHGSACLHADPARTRAVLAAQQAHGSSHRLGHGGERVASQPGLRRRCGDTCCVVCAARACMSLASATTPDLRRHESCQEPTRGVTGHDEPRPERMRQARFWRVGSCLVSWARSTPRCVRGLPRAPCAPGAPRMASVLHDSLARHRQAVAGRPRQATSRAPETAPKARRRIRVRQTPPPDSAA